MTDDYSPPWYLTNPYLQFGWANYIRPMSGIDYGTIEPISATDGGRFHLAWRRAGVPVKRVAIVAPGLGGGHGSRPTKGMVRALNDSHWDVAVWVYRDTGDELSPARRTYNGADIDDLKTVVAAVPTAYTEIALVGLSLGGALVLRYVHELSRDPQNTRVRKAAVVSPPLAFGETVEHWSDSRMGFAPLSWAIVRSMRSSVKEKREWTGLAAPVRAVYAEAARALDRSSRVDEADHDGLSAINEWDNAWHYWRAASTVNKLRDIKIPTRIVTSRDDFFLERHSYPHGDALGHVEFVLSERGSHISFIQRGPTKNYWAEDQVVDYLG